MVWASSEDQDQTIAPIRVEQSDQNSHCLLLD